MIRRTNKMMQDAVQLGLPFSNPASHMSKPPSEPISVRIREAVRLTGLGRSKLYELIASGDVEIVKVGRCTLIPMESLHTLIERARNGELCPHK